MIEAVNYDNNSNLTSDGEKFDYTYNPWGQLVEIVNYSTTKVRNGTLIPWI